MFGREAADKVFSGLARRGALPLDDLDQRLIDVARHRFLIAANVEMRTVLEPAIQLTRLLEHAVLDISLVRAIARECDIKPTEDAILQPLLPLKLIEEVAAEIAFAEEQP